MGTDETSVTTRSLPKGASRVVYRRRISLIRAILVGATISIALIFFIIWYRSWPNQMRCNRQADRVCLALEEYRSKHNSLPVLIKSLPIKSGRFGSEHFEYLFEGIGGPGNLPDGVIIGYCAQPHQPLFAEPWRNVLLRKNGQIISQHISEKELKKLLAKQPPPEHFYKRPEPNLFLP